MNWWVVDWKHEERWLLALGLVVSLAVPAVASVAGFNAATVVVVLLAMILLLFVLTNFELAYAALIILLFAGYHLSWFTLAVCYAPVFALAFFLWHRNLTSRDFSNPMTKPILLYGLCILPSLVNIAHPLPSMYRMFNVVAFLVVMYGTVASVRSYDDLVKIAVLFLGIDVLNSLEVIVRAVITQSRQYGTAGIMFVDLSAFGVCIAAAIALVSRGIRRLTFGVIASVIALALVLTQTRNTWVSALITLLFVASYVLRKPEIFGLVRKRALVLVLAGILVVGGGAVFGLLLNPRVEERAAELLSADENQPLVSETGRVATSLVTRLFIWDTAINAFLAHPVVGIGVYAFPFSSEQYATIPQYFYQQFVKDLTPHQTHLAVLAETGIIGFVGFVIFIVTALKYALRTIREARNERGKQYAFVGAMGLLYCIISMVFTDAWLWGQLIILLGILMGSVFANRRLSLATLDHLGGAET